MLYRRGFFLSNLQGAGVKGGETRFLERKLCKELYSAADGLYGLYDIEGKKKKLRGVRLKFVRLVDILLVLISTK